MLAILVMPDLDCMHAPCAERASKSEPVLQHQQTNMEWKTLQPAMPLPGTCFGMLQHSDQSLPATSSPLQRHELSKYKADAQLTNLRLPASAPRYYLHPRPPSSNPTP